MTTARGRIQIHSAPAALCPHIEWALGAVFGAPAALVWRPQPAERGAQRAESDWTGPAGSAARLASAMRRWDRVRFEVTEEPSADADGVRYAYTPTLGVFHTPMSRDGDALVHEERLRSLLTRRLDADALRGELERLLGAAWDDELDAFRAADEGESVRWLHRVG